MCKEKIKFFAQNAADKIWVARINEKIVGLLALNCIMPFYKSGLFARVDSLVVDQEFRKFGIGKELMNVAEEYAKKIGCDRIFLTSGNHRQSSHDFYSHLGYVSNAKYFVKTLGNTKNHYCEF